MPEQSSNSNTTSSATPHELSGHEQPVKATDEKEIPADLHHTGQWLVPFLLHQLRVARVNSQ